jgi:hypothetical protein
MEYIGNNGKKNVKDIKEWEEIFNPKHWKVGRSAYELANFMLNKNGENVIKQLLDDTLKEKITFSKGYIEYEVKFDEYKNGRVHDLGIWGKTNSNKTIFVGIESKVDEPFNETVKEVYIKNKKEEKNGEKSNTLKRIEKLLERIFSTITEITENQFEIRYQLLYSTVGTIDAKEDKKSADIPIFLIIVFKSKDYDPEKGKKNYEDFKYFIKEIKAKEIFKDKNKEMFEINIEEKDLYIGYLEI